MRGLRAAGWCGGSQDLHAHLALPELQQPELGCLWGCTGGMAPPRLLLQRLEWVQSRLHPRSSADPAGSRVGAAQGSCGEGPAGRLQHPAAPARPCAGDPSSHHIPHRHARGWPSPGFDVLVGSSFLGTQLMQGWGSCGGSVQGRARAAGSSSNPLPVPVFLELLWVGLCPQRTARLSPVVPTAPFAGRARSSLN